ncbi:MAG: rhodanese-like domain-containing protein [Pseudomonadota bacterium]
MIRRVLLGIGGLGLIVLAVLTVLTHESGHVLSEVEDDIRARYSDVSHLSPRAVVSWTRDFGAGIGRRPDVLLVDVRDPGEFAVSRIGGALRIDPGVRPSAVADILGDVRGKTIVFYCSVGERSSSMAQRVQRLLTNRGAIAVHNLSGGIFRWHNEQRQLHNAEGATDYVHPYNTLWGQYVIRQDAVRYSPRPSTAPATRAPLNPS